MDLSNILLLGIAIAVVIFFVRQSRRTKEEAVTRDLHQQTQEEAEAVGIEVGAQADGGLLGGEIIGSTDYQGTTGDIAWTLQSTLRVGQKGRKIGKSTWRTEDIKWPDRKFLLIISTPPDMKTGKIERGGFMNTLINKAADVLLDVYVGAYFGSTYKSLVNIGEDGVKIEREKLQGFTVLTNDQPLAERFLDDATVDVITGWKASSQGFVREQQVDQFGLLFAPDGMLLTCQANMTNPAEVKLLSDFGAVLATKMKGIQRG